MGKNHQERVLRLEVIYGDKELHAPPMLSKIIALLIECNTSSQCEEPEKISS